MSTNNNEISKEKQDFISNVANAIKNKLEFRISGYGTKNGENVFSYLVAPERYNVSGYQCCNYLTQRMKHEFGGCQITNVSELMELIGEIDYCNWPSYWKETTDSEGFREMNEATKSIYRNYVQELRCFWQKFLFRSADYLNDMSKSSIKESIELGISDKNHPLKEDYQVVPDNIIKNADELVNVIGKIYSNRTYLYLDPPLLFKDIADRLTDGAVFKQITPERLENLLAIYREILIDLSDLDGDFKVTLYDNGAYDLLKVIVNILKQNNNIKIIQQIIQWFNSLEYGKDIICMAVRCSILHDEIFKYFEKNKVQLKVDDVCRFLALGFSDAYFGLHNFDYEVMADVLNSVLAYCSDDVSKNKFKLKLDSILGIEQLETLKFEGGSDLSTFFEFLNTNMDKISFSDDFIQKVFNSELDMKYECIPFERWIYKEVYYWLRNKNNEEKAGNTKKRLISLRVTINFILKNSLTGDAKKDGNNFVTSLASIINQSGNNQEIDKLVVEFVFKVLRDNKMADREKLFIDELSSELRPEITSVSYEPEAKNLSNGVNSDSYDNIEENPQPSSENSQVVATQNNKEENSQESNDNPRPESSNINGTESNVQEGFKLNSAGTNPKLSDDVNLNSANSCDAEKKGKEDGPQKDVNSLGQKDSKVDEDKSNQAETFRMPIGAQDNSESKSDNVVPETDSHLNSKGKNQNKQINTQQKDERKNSVSSTRFSRQIENFYFGRSQNCYSLNKSADEIYSLLAGSPNFCRDVCMLETMIEKKKYQELNKNLTSFQKFRVTIYYYLFFWWRYRRNNKIDFSQPNMKNRYSSKRDLREKSGNHPEMYPLDKSEQNKSIND